MVFGVFDGVHDGHRVFLKEAKTCGDYLIVAIAQDEVVLRLKGRLPDETLENRIDGLKREPFIDEVVPGDAVVGTYEVVFEHRPEVIALGYDQGVLKEDLEKSASRFFWKPKIVVMGGYGPDTYHSSLLNK